MHTLPASACHDTCCRPEEGVEVVTLGHERRRSRKTRFCDDCSGAILRGEMYERIAVKVDGEVRTVSAHTTSQACI